MRVVLWIAAGLVLWCGACGLTLLSAGEDVDAARSLLSRWQAVDDPAAIDLDELHRDLDEAASLLDSASGSLNGAALRPASWLPVVGRQLASARALVEAPRVIVSEALPAVEAVQAASDSTPGERVRLLEVASGHLDAIHDVAAERDLGPDEALLARLAVARTELEAELVDLEARLEPLRLGTSALAALLDGGSYLVLGANNAEMQLGSGMHLSVGKIEFDGGQATLTDFGPAEARFPVVGADIVDDDLDARWGFLAPTNDYRKLALSARFDEVVAPQALEMWRAQTGEQLDGVLALDIVALAAVVDAVGGVEFEGEQLDGAAAQQYALLDQYVEFDGLDRDDRRDVLGELATAAVAQVASGGWNPIEFLGALRDAASGRHLMIYSVDPAMQAGWRALAADGAIEASDLGVFVLNLGASKLDPFMDVSVDVSVDREGEQLRLDIEVANNAPSALPSYVVGPWSQIGLEEAGTYLGRVAVYSPAGASSLDIEGDPALEVFGPDGPVGLAVTRIEVAPGASERLTVVIDFPRLPGKVTIVPSARLPYTAWTWAGGDEFDDSERREVAPG